MNFFELPARLPLTYPQINPHALCAFDGKVFTAQIIPFTQSCVKEAFIGADFRHNDDLLTRAIRSVLIDSI